MVWAPLLPLALLPLFWDQAPVGSPCLFLPNLGPSQGLAWPPFLTGHQNEGAPEPQAGVPGHCTLRGGVSGWQRE